MSKSIKRSLYELAAIFEGETIEEGASLILDEKASIKKSLKRIADVLDPEHAETPYSSVQESIQRIAENFTPASNSDHNNAA